MDIEIRRSAPDGPDTGPGARSLGINVHEPSYHDGVGYFTDLMRQGSGWFSWDREAPWEWTDGRALALDDTGTPTDLAPGQAARTILLLDAPAYEPGRYTLTWEGRGTLLLETPGGPVEVDDSADAYAVNSATVELAPGIEEVHLFLSILARDADDPIRDIRLFAPGEGPGSSLFSDRFLADLEPFSTVRLMDWNKTNWGTHGAWEDRARLDWSVWGAADTFDGFDVGVPYEVIAALANETGKDIWLTVPHQVDDGYVRRMAELFSDRLAPGITVTLEYSNEAWNWIFPAHAAMVARADETRAAEGHGEYHANEAYARRATEVFAIWEEVFAADPDNDVVTTLSGQAGWAAVLEGSLAEVARLGRLDLVDQVAIAPYFPDPEESEGIAALLAAAPGGVSEGEWAGVFAGLARDVAALWDPGTAYGAEIAANLEVAARHGLGMVAYEGGQHLVAWDEPGLRGLVAEANARPEMRDLYVAYLDGWERASGGAEMTLFHLAGFWGAEEAFGHKAYGGQPDAAAPKYRGALDWLEAASAPEPQPGPAPAGPILGTEGRDVLAGTRADERLEGLGGDDLLVAGGGDDTLAGGEGTDVAIVFHPRAAVAKSVLPDGRVLLEAPGSRLTLEGVERAALEDGAWLFEVEGPDARFAYLLYRAALGRTPDAEGFAVWAEARAAGAPRKALAEAFAASAEFRARLMDASPEALVDLLYAGQLGREADPHGRAWWAGELRSGRIDEADLLIAFALAEETLAVVADDVEEGFWVAAEPPDLGAGLAPDHRGADTLSLLGEPVEGGEDAPAGFPEL